VLRRVVSTSRKVASFLGYCECETWRTIYGFDIPGEYLLFVCCWEGPVLEEGKPVEASDFDECANEKWSCLEENSCESSGSKQ
jgi:hypothetical protein